MNRPEFLRHHTSSPEGRTERTGRHHDGHAEQQRGGDEGQVAARAKLQLRDRAQGVTFAYEHLELRSHGVRSRA
ncbi:hypothetical protein ACFWD7_51095 [Streptomyces mirabilis]|uniref:hypothetical protein n=1 Tax=Streptomyces mirabilis TaxID=68239 RepID=UPI0021C0440C|nr:hypothetical protein [Streptomyces mirabilis]MCT9113881.1 hypothetical protein [Streptomyces mirabilis]